MTISVAARNDTHAQILGVFRKWVSVTRIKNTCNKKIVSQNVPLRFRRETSHQSAVFWKNRWENASVHPAASCRVKRNISYIIQVVLGYPLSVMVIGCFLENCFQIAATRAKQQCPQTRRRPTLYEPTQATVLISAPTFTWFWYGNGMVFVFLMCDDTIFHITCCR